MYVLHEKEKRISNLEYQIIQQNTFELTILKLNTV